MLLTAAHPLLALRHLTAVTLWFDHGEIMLSDMVLESFAEAWPAPVSLRICFGVLSHSDPSAPPVYLATVTLRSFRAFARHCSSLQSPHIPHLYVPVEDCADDTYWDGSEYVRDHQLPSLAVCRAIIQDVRWCASALHRIFPHLDIGGSRDLYVRSHRGHNSDVREDQVFSAIWLGMLDALEGYQIPPPKSDAEGTSTFDGEQSERSGI
ncbi:hypothetical protein TRAPUB_2644 [Trametes pubescens]|uniref:Uncharacterized protein n=1 Tax=Trametes pubescens TaxID=154538 RepID=A0A1M2VFW8_TRAPU|nr:hypothetical protein TRAPUB_2644 [Trametes pubescens]